MYKIRKEVVGQLKNKYIVDKLEFSETWVSQLYGKEIKDLFEKVGK